MGFTQVKEKVKKLFTKKVDFYTKKNLDKDSIKIIESPSGKYTLETSRYKTREGCWSYTRGRVFDADGNLIDMWL